MPPLVVMAARGGCGRRAACRLYADVDPRLLRAAERNVIAHLDKLRGEGRVRDVAEGWVAV